MLIRKATTTAVTALALTLAGTSCSSKNADGTEEAVAPDTEAEAEGETAETAAAEGEAPAEGATTEEGAAAEVASDEAAAAEATTETATTDAAAMEGEATTETAEATDEVAAAESTEAATPESTETADAAVVDPALSNEMEAVATPVDSSAPAAGDDSAEGTQQMVADTSGGDVSQDVAQVPTQLGNGARVKYVQKGSVSVYADASEGSSVVRTARKGDHMLVEVSGDWAKVSSGGFIKTTDLTDRAVGRPRGTGRWN